MKSAKMNNSNMNKIILDLIIAKNLWSEVEYLNGFEESSKNILKENIELLKRSVGTENKEGL
jgi:hypothetical protein